MPVCAGYNCHKRIYKGVSLFKFPKNPKVCKKWLECLGRTDLFDFSYEDLKNGGFRVCQKHFHDSDIYMKGAKTFLKKTALPTVQQYCSPNEILKESPFSYFTEEGNKPIIEPRKKKDKKLDLALDLKDVITPADEEVIEPLENVTVIHYCSIPMCSNNSQQQPHLQFHIMPDGKCNRMAAPDSVLVVWQKFLNTILSLWGMQGSMLKKQNCIRICSIHFKTESFDVPPVKDVPGSKVVLKPLAYPSIDPLFESYLTAQKKLSSDRKVEENKLPKPLINIAPKKVGNPPIQLIGRPAVIKPGMIQSSSSKAAKVTPAPIINLTQAAKMQQPVKLGAALPGAKLPISRRPSEPPKAAYYLLPMVSAKSDNSQMLLIPTGENSALPVEILNGEKKPRGSIEKKLHTIRAQGQLGGVINAIPVKRKAPAPIGVPEPAKKQPTILAVASSAGSKTFSPANARTEAASQIVLPDPVVDIKPVVASSSGVKADSSAPLGVAERRDDAPLLKPRAGTFLRLNDLGSSAKLANFNLKVHGTVQEPPKQPSAVVVSEIAVSSVTTATETLSHVQSDPFPPSSTTAPNLDSQWASLGKRIKIEEIASDASPQPFLSVDALMRAGALPSVVQSPETSRVKVEVETDANEVMCVDSRPKNTELTSDVAPAPECQPLKEDKGPFAIHNGQPRCATTPEDAVWQGDGTHDDGAPVLLYEGQPVSHFSHSEPAKAKRQPQPPAWHICQYCGSVVRPGGGCKSIGRHEYHHRCADTCHCFLCQAPFPSAQALHAHMESHAVDGVVQCPHCERAFSNMIELARHFDGHVDAMTYECVTCKVRLCSEEVLRIHAKMHESRADTTAAKPTE